MNVFMEIFLFFMTVLQFLFPFAFKDSEEVPEQPTDSVVEEVVPGDHVHTGGNCLIGAVCEICGEVYAEEGEHLYITTVKQATCTEDGYVSYRCNYCFYTYTGSVTPAKGHSYSETLVDATCTSWGLKITSCSGCGSTDTVRTDAPKGHNFELVKTIPADCINNETEVYVCYDCNSTNYKEIPGTAVGAHYYEVIYSEESTCSVQGYDIYKCTGCTDSYKEYKDKLEHNYGEYVYQNDATCTADGTKIAYCTYNCGTRSEAVTAVGTKLPHADADEDTYCDECETKIYIEYTYLQYPDAAMANVSLETFIANGDKKNTDVYAANKGTSYNGIIKSPYYTLVVTGKVNGASTATSTSIPVYGTVVHNGDDEKGALHSFAEIYVAAGSYQTFDIELRGISGYVSIDSSTKILPESLGENAYVQNGVLRATLSGIGVHTILVNGSQDYALTIHVREQYDDDAVIASLRSQGYNVRVFEGYNALDYISIAGKETGKMNVIYLKKGAYLVANHTASLSINSDSDNSSKAETINGRPASELNGLSQIRAPFICAHDTRDIMILGYGAIDLSRLDRAERRGVAFTFVDNVLAQGFKIINSPEWSFITYRCQNVTVKDVDVFGYRQNADAFDICNSINADIDGCFMRSGDDGVAVKNLGGDKNAFTYDISVLNCYAWSGKARAFGIFGETNHSFTDVFFRDCVVLSHDAAWDTEKVPAMGIVAESCDQIAGVTSITLENIVFENIEICRNDVRAIGIITFDQLNKDFAINNVTFRNIKYKNNTHKIFVDKHVKNNVTVTISDVTFSDVMCNGVLLEDSNKVTYFEKEAYEGGYINFENTK